MKIKTDCNCAGIYIIKCLVNGKIYVGKSKNCYKRLHQHISDCKIDNRNYNENRYLLNAVKKYGLSNFTYYIIEKIDESCENLDEILSEKELYWITKLNALNKNIGYNLRLDSDTKCICSEETKIKIGERAKQDWINGCHNDHAKKLKEYWKNNDERKEQQSKLFSKLKTKYSYIIYDTNNNLITNSGDYSTLKKLNIHKAAPSAFSKNKCNEVTCKGYKIIRKEIKI